MRKSIFAVIAFAFAHLSSGQLTALPSCSLDCAVTALSGDGCALLDLTCHCKTDSIAKTSLGTCVKGACSQPDQQQFLHAIGTNCGNGTDALKALTSTISPESTTTPQSPDSSVTPANNPSNNPSSNPSNDPSNVSLSPAVAAGVGAGAGAAGILIVTLAILLITRRRRRQLRTAKQAPQYINTAVDTASMLSRTNNPSPIDTQLLGTTAEILAYQPPTLKKNPSLRINDPLPPPPPSSPSRQKRVVELPTARYTQRYELDGEGINLARSSDLEKGSLG